MFFLLDLNFPNFRPGPDGHYQYLVQDLPSSKLTWTLKTINF